MKTFGQTLVLFGALSGSLLALQSANAYEKVRRNETYCLETAVGGKDGGTVNLCQFVTREQCIASKVAQGDHCELNPVLAFEEWNKTHRR